MRTSEEIYHRVRWDPRFDAARFVLGVNIRAAAPKRIPLPSFVPGGDIPWHRVLFIEADGELVWDRAAQLDRLDATDAGRIRAPQLLREPFFTPRAPEPGPAVTPAGVGLRVLTWNTLWDRYDADRIYTADRRPLLLAALAAADADVIALQEVETELLAMLRAAAWVRAGYTVCGHRSDVDRYGLVLLSRLPVREAAWHALGPYKAIAGITVETATGPVVVLNTHLTSDHSDNGAARRVQELNQVADGLAGIDADVILVGDFNDGTDGPATRLRLRDTWTEVHGPDDQTPTFDPVANPLAAVSSLTGRASRLDRILVRGRVRAASATLVGDQAVGPEARFISDHAGVLSVLTLHSGEEAPGLDVAPTARTALAWLPPEDAAVQRIRAAHDPQVDRWPAHVNVLFGFVPEVHFEAAAALVGEALREVGPFEAYLDGVKAFDHRDDSTVWLDPATGDPAPWAALHAALRQRFPRCVGRAEGYVPHLTLGRTRDVARFTSEVAGQLAGRPAPVAELVLLSRRGDEPMRPRATVALGTGALTWLDPTSDAVPTVDTLDPTPLVRRVADALDGAVVHVAGSRRLGCARPGADLDLVAAVAGEPDLDPVEARLPVLRRVTGARVPGLRLRLGGIDVDLAVVGTGSLDPAEAVARRAELGPDAAVALSAVSDAEAVLAAAARRPAAFAQLAAEVKAWARARGLDSAPFGGVPGLAWSMLSAMTVRAADPDASAVRLRRLFFATWAAWDWHEPVALNGEVGPPGPALSLYTPTAPVRLLTAQVGPGWENLLGEEFYRAWELVEASDEPWAELLAPPPLHRRHAAWAVVRLGPGADAGRVRGRLRALITALEEEGVHEVHGWPRPIDDAGSVAIGLGRRPPSAADLAHLARGWLRGLPDVEVVWLEGGALDTLA